MTTKSSWQLIRLPQVSLFWLMLAAITILQWMLGMLHSAAAALTTLGYLGVAFLMTIAGHYYRKAFGWQDLARVFARVALATSTAISLVLLLSIKPFGFWSQLNAAAGQLMQFSALSVAIGLSSWLYLLVSRQLNKPLAIVSGLLLLSGMVLIFGANGWWVIFGLAALAVIQQIIAMRTQNGSREKRDWLHLSLFAVPVFLLLGWLLPAATSPIAPSFIDTMALAFKIAIEHPWLGTGAGNTGWQSFLSISQPAVPGKVGVFNHAPNALMQLWLDFGIFALFALVAAIVVWLKSIRWQQLALEQVWLLTTLGLMLAVSMFSANFHHAFYLILLAFLLGVGDEKQETVRFPMAGSIGTVIALVAVVAALTTAGIANAKLIRAEGGELNQPETVKHLQWVHAYSLLSPQAVQVFASKLNDDETNLALKLWITDAVMRYQPAEKVAYQRSVLLELSGQHAQAVDFLKLTLNAYPIKLNDMLAYYSPYNMQVFLNVLFEARPPKKSSDTQKDKTSETQKQQSSEI